MRSLLVAVMLSVFALTNVRGESPSERIAQVPDGTISEGSYSNTVFEMSFHIQDGWTSMLIPASSLQFAPELAAGDPVNLCSRPLFSTAPGHTASSPFGPKTTYFAFDPACFPGIVFPRSINNRSAVTEFSRQFVHALSHTRYISPGGVDFGDYAAGKRNFVTLTSARNLVIPKSDVAQGQKVHVNTRLVVTESSGYWIVMAEVLDDASKRIMQNAGVGEPH